jgi:hypothetical protein
MKNRNVNLKRAGDRALVAFTVFVTASAIVLVGCTASQVSDDNSSDSKGGNRTALCKFNADINEAARQTETPEATITMLKRFESRFAQALEDAPSQIKPSVQTLSDAATIVIRTKDIASVESKLDDIGQATYEIDAFCEVQR